MENHKPKLTEKLIVDGEVYFASLVQDINRAQTRVFLESYIFNDDEAGNPVMQALSSAAKRGVDVRLMIDGFGSYPWLGAKLSKLIKDGVKVKIYHPLPWLFWQWQFTVSKRFITDRFIYLLSVINRRNHRKTCVIDHHTAYIGSFNITAEHLPHSNSKQNWRDTCVRIESSKLDVVESTFINTWNNSLRKCPSYFDTEARFRINIPRHMRRFLYKNLLHRINTCSSRVLITNAYFIPEPRLIRALIRAARRGIQVELIVPSVSDIFFIPWVSSTLYPRMIKAGIKIHEYEAGILHAKTILIDDWAVVGSSNLNSRSLLHDLEIDYVLQTTDNIKAMAEQFADDRAHSKTINESELTRKSLILRAFGRLILYLRYWL